MGRSILARALPLVLALVLVAAAAPAVHEHRADAPAIYDERCAFAQLATHGPAIGFPPVVDLIAPLPPAGIAFLPPPPDATDATRLPPVSRGPPIPG